MSKNIQYRLDKLNYLAQSALKEWRVILEWEASSAGEIVSGLTILTIKLSDLLNLSGGPAVHKLPRVTRKR